MKENELRFFISTFRRRDFSPVSLPLAGRSATNYANVITSTRPPIIGHQRLPAVGS